jgi:hypothetical protein
MAHFWSIAPEFSAVTLSADCMNLMRMDELARIRAAQLTLWRDPSKLPAGKETV